MQNDYSDHLCSILTKNINFNLLLWYLYTVNVMKKKVAAYIKRKIITNAYFILLIRNLPGSPIPRILQARTLEWVAISFSNA